MHTMSNSIFFYPFYDVGVKKVLLSPTDAYELLRCEAAPAILRTFRNPLIYYVNRYFLMFGGSQVQKPYHASVDEAF